MAAKALWAIVLVSILLFAGCAGKQNPAPVPEVNNSSSPPAGGAQIANPASVNCVGKGYKLEIRKDASGGEAGYCVFGNGKECEEWAFYRGECGPNGTNARQPAKEGEFCGGIAGFACESGLSCKLDGDYPDSGGKCEKKQVSFTPCPAKRGEMCTMEYSPVCGRSGTKQSTYGYKTYPNSCVACSLSSPALDFAQGACEALNLTGTGKVKGVLYDCPAKRPESCANESDPVCGRVADPSSSFAVFRDYAGECAACSAGSNAIAYYIGTCEEK